MCYHNISLLNVHHTRSLAIHLQDNFRGLVLRLETT
nr:MAG TPA: hypothetical protein [Caudoviricetes sp.]